MKLEDLRTANRRRLPEFKNSKGEPAHKFPDGHDWSPAQWLQALVGEVGELAEVRLDYEAGNISSEEYAEYAAKEAADIQIYLDLFCLRALDFLAPYEERGTNRTYQGCVLGESPAQILMALMAQLGGYANARKKLDRGDLTPVQFVSQKDEYLSEARQFFEKLEGVEEINAAHPGDRVDIAHPYGIPLAKATAAKFNEVSIRVGSSVMFDHNHNID